MCSRVNKNGADVNTHTCDSAGITNMGSLMYDGHAHDTTFEKEKQHTSYILYLDKASREKLKSAIIILYGTSSVEKLILAIHNTSGSRLNVKKNKNSASFKASFSYLELLHCLTLDVIVFSIFLFS